MLFKNKLHPIKRNTLLKLDRQPAKKQAQVEQPQVRVQRKLSSTTIKQRSHSDLKFRKKIYKQVKFHDKDEVHWIQQLKISLQFGQTIQQFQKIQLNRNMQPTKKLTIRQAYQLKRQILRIVQQNQQHDIQQLVFQQISGKIQQLLDVALDDKQRNKLLNFSFFLKLKIILQVKINDSISKDKSSKKLVNSIRTYSLQKNQKKQGFNLQYKQSVVELIKLYIEAWNSDNLSEPDTVKLKILTIACLHILKLKPPMVLPQEIILISKTIHLKKQFLVLKDFSSKKQKRQFFQSLMYLIFKFYKVLYYLKLDEQLKFDHYNQLCAYLQLYSSDPRHYLIFQSKYSIQKQLNIIQPASIGINVYLDSKQRNQIKYTSLKRQINGNLQTINSNPHLKIKINNVQDLKSSNLQSQDYNLNQENGIQNNQASNKSFNSSNNSSKQFIYQQRQTKDKKNNNNQKIPRMNSTTTAKNRLSIFQNIQNLRNMATNESSKVSDSTNNQFQFLFFKFSKVYKGKFQIKFTNGFSLFEIDIKIISHSGNFINNERIKSLKNVAQDLKIQSFRKVIWSVFKKIFLTNLIEQQNPLFLKYDIYQQNHIKTYLPDGLHHKEAQTMSLIHDYLIYWFHSNVLKHFFNGMSYYIPLQSKQQMDNFLQNLQNQKDRKLFSKRRGYMNVQSSQNKSGINYSELYKSFQFQKEEDLYNQKQRKQLSIQSVQTQHREILRILPILQIVKVKGQYKLIKIKFQNHLRSLFIFQLGFSKHLKTDELDSRIQKLRALTYGNTRKTIKFIQIVLAILQNKHLSVNKNAQDDQLYAMLSDNLYQERQFKIKQLFQIDLIQNKMLSSAKEKIKVFNQIPNNQNRQKINLALKIKRTLMRSKVFFKRKQKLQIVQKKQYSWGIRYLGIKNQYFKINNNVKDNQTVMINTQNELFAALQLYKILVIIIETKMIEQQINSKVNFQQKQYILASKVCLNKKICKTQRQSQINQYLCLLQQKIYVQIFHHKIIKSANAFYIVNLYKPIKIPDNLQHADQEQKSVESQDLALIQLVDLKNLVKYMSVTVNKKCFDFKKLLDIEKKTFDNKRMQNYTDQLIKNQQNDESKTKIYSQANYYYQMWLKNKRQHACDFKAQ